MAEWLNARDSKSCIQATVSRVQIPSSPPEFKKHKNHQMKTFNEQVYDIVAKIPAGRVATFGQIAAMIGRPRMARFVGYASNNKNSWHLPWHRVVFKDGSLCNGFFDEQYKQLKAEGVKFDKDKKVKMQQFQWDPDRDGVPMDIKDFPLVF